MIRYGLPTSVYSVSLGSFDTHSDQADTHAGLLSSLDAAIESFMSVFPTAAPGKSPVIVIYSEFGRTPRVNASGGTDHSSASVVLVVGPAVKGGFYGATPSFTKLDRYGNFVFTTDFRKVYATVLEGSSVSRGRQRCSAIRSARSTSSRSVPRRAGRTSGR